MVKLNSRFVAFLRLHHNVTWEKTRYRNASYVSWISDMVSLYTGTKDSMDSRRHIEDHDDFTKFIEKYVAEQLGE